MCGLVTCTCVNAHHNVFPGKGVGYMPGAVCLAATHREKLKSIRQSALKKANLTEQNQKLCVINFEKVASKHDKQMREKAGENQGTMFTTSAVHFLTNLFDFKCAYY